MPKGNTPRQALANTRQNCVQGRNWITLKIDHTDSIPASASGRESSAVHNLIALFTLSILFLSPVSIPVLKATSFYPVPFVQAVQDAGVIVRGTVGQSYVDYVTDAQGGRRLYTFYPLHTTETFKTDDPQASETIILRSLGGEKDGIGMHVEGAAQFEQNEDTVVFLGKSQPGEPYDMQGMMGGKYVIKTNDRGEEFLLGGIYFAEQKDTDGSIKTEWTLADLRRIVREQSNGVVPVNVSKVAVARPLSSPTPTAISAAPEAVTSATPDADELPTPESSPAWLWVGGSTVLLILVVLVVWIFARQ